MTVKDAGLAVGIAVRTAQFYVKRYRDDAEQRLPVSRAGHGLGGGNRTLFEKHTTFLIDFWEAKPSATLTEACDALALKFDGLRITQSGLRKHAIKHCQLTLKKLEKLPAARASERIPNLDYLSSCVFLDEAGFNMHLRRGFGWSKKVTPAKTVIPTQKGVNITILGAICEFGVVCLKLRKPVACVSNKEGKKVKGVIGTRTTDYVAFIDSVMDILDQRGMKGRYLVMDNAPIHKSPNIRAMIESRGYNALYCISLLGLHF